MERGGGGLKLAREREEGGSNWGEGREGGSKLERGREREGRSFKARERGKGGS